MSEARADRTRASFTFLEWNFFGRHGFVRFASHGRIRPRSKELDPLRYDLGALAFAAAVLALEFPRLQSAFNIGEWRGASQPRALAEPDLSLSIHPAPIIQSQVSEPSERTAVDCGVGSHATTSRSLASGPETVCICAWPTAR